MGNELRIVSRDFKASNDVLDHKQKCHGLMAKLLAESIFQGIQTAQWAVSKRLTVKLQNLNFYLQNNECLKDYI